MPARQLRPPPAPAPAPHPRVTRRPEQVELALLSAEGDGAWVFFAPESDLRPRIGECYRAALDKEPGVTGHMVFSVTRPLGGAASVELVTRSELPSVLVDCIEQVLETLQTSPDLALSPNVPPSHVYVSLY